jgi:hypothetical protein
LPVTPMSALQEDAKGGPKMELNVELKESFQEEQKEQPEGGLREEKKEEKEMPPRSLFGGVANIEEIKEVAQNEEESLELGLFQQKDSLFSIETDQVVPLPKSSDSEAIEVAIFPQKEEPSLKVEVKIDSTSSPSAVAWKEVAQLLAQESSLKFGWLRFGEFFAEEGKQFQVDFHPSFQHRTETLFWSQVRKKVQKFLQEKRHRSLEFVPRFTGTSLPSEESLLAQELAEEPESSSSTSSLNVSPIVQRRERAEEKQKKSSSLEENTPNSGLKGVKEDSSEITPLTPEELEAFKKDPLIQEALKIFEAEIIT